MLDRPEEYEKMANAEDALWWYRALHRQVLRTLQRHLPDLESSLIDAGCGTGGLMRYLRRHGYLRLRGFDLSPDAIQICRRRGLDIRPGNLLKISAFYPPAAAAAVISNDTLCYLTDEQRAQFLEGCRSVLAPGGLVILNLPALQGFRGIHDRSVGIAHRFCRADVRRLFAAGEWQILQERYWPFLVAPLIYTVRLRQRRALTRGEDCTIRSDIDLPPRWVNRVLEYVTNFENSVLPYTPFGSSLFVVARR